MYAEVTGEKSEDVGDALLLVVHVLDNMGIANSSKSN
jgi:hypothetical protein